MHVHIDLTENIEYFRTKKIKLLWSKFLYPHNFVTTHKKIKCFSFYLVADMTSALVILKELTSLRRKNRMLMNNHPFCEYINLKYCCEDRVNLKIKKMISMPLMMENPVRSPMVPPMRLSWASVLIFLSLSMSSKVAVLNR